MNDIKKWCLHEIDKLKFAFVKETIDAPMKFRRIYGQDIPTKYDLQTAFVANMKVIINVALMKDPLSLQAEKDGRDDAFQDMMNSLDTFTEKTRGASELDQEISQS